MTRIVQEARKTQKKRMGPVTKTRTKNTNYDHTANDTKKVSIPVSVTNMLKTELKVENNAVTRIKSEYSTTLLSTVNGKRKPPQKLNTDRERTCNFCAQVFLYWKDFAAHMLERHNDRLNQRRKLKHDSQMFNFKIPPSILDLIQPKDKDKKHLCEDCGTSYHRLQNWKRHLEVHHKGITLICHICSKELKDKRSLELHVENLHEKTMEQRERKHECQECNRTFLHMTHLNRHILVKHSAFERIPCGDCTKTFTEKRELLRHTTAVHLKLKDYQCNQCDKKFSRTSNLNTHVQTVHLRLKKFACIICFAQFGANRYLKNHMATHTNKFTLKTELKVNKFLKFN